MKKINKNLKKQKNINSKKVGTDKKVVSKKSSGASVKTAHKRTDEVDFSKTFEKMTKKELCENLYDAKRKLGEKLIPIGRKTPLTKQEFTKRYINGVGGTNGFKKSELIQLNERYVSKLVRGYDRKK